MQEEGVEYRHWFVPRNADIQIPIGLAPLKSIMTYPYPTCLPPPQKTMSEKQCQAYSHYPQTLRCIYSQVEVLELTIWKLLVGLKANSALEKDTESLEFWIFQPLVWYFWLLAQTPVNIWASLVLYRYNYFFLKLLKPKLEVILCNGKFKNNQRQGLHLSLNTKIVDSLFLNC